MRFTPYAQGDSRWSNLQLGSSGLLMQTSGCYVTALASIWNKLPSVVLEAFNKNGCFTPEGALDNAKVAQVMGLIYAKVTQDPKKMCVMETNHYAPHNPQHFVVWVGDGKYIMDTTDGKIKLNPYHPISFRLWDNRHG